jgi:hypothetical protein
MPWYSSTNYCPIWDSPQPDNTLDPSLQPFFFIFDPSLSIEQKVNVDYLHWRAVRNPAVSIHSRQSGPGLWLAPLGIGTGLRRILAVYNARWICGHQ